MGGMSPSLMSQTFRDDVFSYYSTYILYKPYQTPDEFLDPNNSDQRWKIITKRLVVLGDQEKWRLAPMWPPRNSTSPMRRPVLRFPFWVFLEGEGVVDGLRMAWRVVFLFLDIWYIHVLLSTLTTNQAHYGGSGERKMVLLCTLSPSPFWMESICMNKNYFYDCSQGSGRSFFFKWKNTGMIKLPNLGEINRYKW